MTSLRACILSGIIAALVIAAPARADAVHDVQKRGPPMTAQLKPGSLSATSHSISDRLLPDALEYLGFLTVFVSVVCFAKSKISRLEEDGFLSLVISSLFTCCWLMPVVLFVACFLAAACWSPVSLLYPAFYCFDMLLCVLLFWPSLLVAVVVALPIPKKNKAVKLCFLGLQTFTLIGQGVYLQWILNGPADIML
jgi:hypothetical protein